MQGYYANPAVRARMIEFLGGSTFEEATAVYLTAHKATTYHAVELRRLDAFRQCLDRGLDIGRSLWDRESLLVDLDIEYVNFDHPEIAYDEPDRVFHLQKPVEWATEQVLSRYGIAPLHLVSGRGHHFLWRVARGSPAFWQLQELGRISLSLEEYYRRPQPPVETPVPHELGEAFAGLGLVMEYLTHQIKQQGEPDCEIPVQLTAVAVTPGERGRELISLDISEYGDPLNSRALRIPFSVYLKPTWEGKPLVPDGEPAPCLFLIPLHEMDIHEAIQVMRDRDRVAHLAERASAQIPEQSAPMQRLINDYRGAAIADAHDWFYSQEQELPENWPNSYDRTPMQPLPPCVRHILKCPNDLLLKPIGLSQVVYTMLALGWHPRHIAGLIRSKFERDYGWTQWAGYDPTTRSEFYTRLFSTLVVVDRAPLAYFNCGATKAKGVCFYPEDQCDLDAFRNSLRARKEHERLACGPFNRLFLPDEHL